MRIEPCTAAQDAVLWDMLRPVFRAGRAYAVDPDIPRDAALAFWCGGGHRAFLASEGGVAVGSYYLCRNQGGGGAHVANAGFVTAPAARGRGVARAMLGHALDEARAAGFLAMQFNFVVATNRRAIDLWRAFGFDIAGRLPQAFRHPTEGFVDAFVMYRTL